MPNHPLVEAPWERTLREAYLAGRANVFVLHGHVDDFQLDASGAFASLPGAVLAMLGRTRPLLADVSGTGLVRLSGPADVRRAALAWARPGHKDAPLPVDPSLSLPIIGRLLATPAHPCGVVVRQADLLLGSATDPTARGAVAAVREWLDDPAARDTNNVAVLVADRLADLAPQLRHHPRLVDIEVGFPSDEVKLAALASALGAAWQVPPGSVDPLILPHTLAEVAALATRLAGLSRLIDVATLAADPAVDRSDCLGLEAASPESPEELPEPGHV